MLLWNNVSKFRLGHLLSAPVQRRNLFESARSALFCFKNNTNTQSY